MPGCKGIREIIPDIIQADPEEKILKDF